MNAGGYDTLIRRGLVFSGHDAPPRHADVGIRNGRVAIISEHPLPEDNANEVIG